MLLFFIRDDPKLSNFPDDAPCCVTDYVAVSARMTMCCGAH